MSKKPDIPQYAPEDLVVYPAQGMGSIERIESQEIGGVAADFYVVRIFSSNVTLLVPVANAHNVGLRYPVDKETAEAIFADLQDHSKFTGYTGQNWNRRYREYSEKLKSSSLADVAFVLKELLLIGRNKDLSFGERRLLEQASALVVGEMAHALERDDATVREELTQIFALPVESVENETNPLPSSAS